MPSTSSPDPAIVAWSKANNFLRRLGDSLEDLERSGGLGRVARAERWRPAAIARAEASLVEAREAIDGIIKHCQSLGHN